MDNRAGANVYLSVAKSTAINLSPLVEVNSRLESLGLAIGNVELVTVHQDGARVFHIYRIYGKRTIVSCE